MTKPFLLALPLAILAAGCSGSGAREAGPVPTAPSQPATASTPETTPTTPALALCSDKAVAVKLASRQGAAGTISTVWSVRNTAASPCRSFGYPGMDFHTASGWLNVRVHRGGFPNIDVAPARVVLQPGQSLYFVSYWNDVSTSAGSCKEFDRVKVTLPDNFTSAERASSGCLDPGSVDVGPVSARPPS